MNRRSLVAFAAIVVLVCSLPVIGGAPVKVTTVAPVDDLVAEVDAKIAMLEEYIASDEELQEAVKRKQLSQAAGVIACLAQAVVEHDSRADAKIAAAELRDAAIALRAAKTLEAAQAGLAKVKESREGKSSGSSQDEHAWNKLISLHDLMEEVNSRNSKLRRSTRRSRDPKVDSLNASTLAVLALVIHEDTHEVKDDSKIPQWQEMSLEFQKGMTNVAELMKKEDFDAAYPAWRATQETCNSCHEVFKEE